MKKKICCVYKIIDQTNGKFYLGSSEDFEKRKKRHLKDLRLNCHHNIYLQRSYNKHGEDCFIFKIIKICSPSQRIKTEQHHLNKLNFNKCYNISKSASGGNLIANHPNREKIIQRATEILLKINQTPEAIARNKSYIGKKNPNYGNKWSQSLRKHVSKIKKQYWKNLPEEERSKIIKTMTKANRKFWDSEAGKEIKHKKSKRMKGKNNHFYGKKHSKKTLKILKEKMTGKANVNCRKRVSIEGINYESATIAANNLQMNLSKLTFRCHSSNPKFKSWFFIDNPKITKLPNYGNPIKYKYKDQVFNSITEASLFFNKSIEALIFRAKSKNPKWKDYSLIPNEIK